MNLAGRLLQPLLPVGQSRSFKLKWVYINPRGHSATLTGQLCFKWEHTKHKQHWQKHFHKRVDLDKGGSERQRNNIKFAWLLMLQETEWPGYKKNEKHRLWYRSWWLQHLVEINVTTWHSGHRQDISLARFSHKSNIIIHYREPLVIVINGRLLTLHQTKNT